MKRFERIMSGLDVAGLVAQLNARPDLWGQHGQRRAPDSPHAASDDIWLRYREYAELTEPARFIEPHESVWYPSAAVLPDAVLIADRLMQAPAICGERLGGVLITRLPPGAEIKPHVDHGWHAGHYQKFYVALRNKPGSVFGWPTGDLHAAEGDVWWFRNDVSHWVVNGSDTERLSMIVCIRTDKFAHYFAQKLAA